MELGFYDYFEHISVEVHEVISGWLSPQGEFIYCDWGEHTKLAYEILEKNNWMDEYIEKRKECISEYSRDFLVKEKGYILLDCPNNNGHTQKITYNPYYTRKTAQINKIFDLFEKEQASQYIIETMIGTNR